jgi:tRNA(Ile)-lysidine synthase
MPLGMRSERKVSDLLTDRKVPAWRKRLVPVVLAGRRIVWVCGIAVDDRAKVDDRTKQVLQFSFHFNV